MDDTFVQWVLTELDDRGWSQRELARRAGISAAAVNQILTEQRQPTAEFSIAIARALRVPPEAVLRRAGHLPPVPDNGHQDEGTEFLIQRLKAMLPLIPREERDRVIDTILSYASAIAAAQRAMESVTATEDNATRPPP